MGFSNFKRWGWEGVGGRGGLEVKMHSETVSRGMIKKRTEGEKILYSGIRGDVIAVGIQYTLKQDTV